jgi:aminoglycoside phosphotransferase (APT) family kinase protein
MLLAEHPWQAGWGVDAWLYDMTIEQEKTCQAVTGAQFPGAKLERWEKLTGGVSADVYRLDLAYPNGTQHVVLRVHGANHSGHPADLEFSLLQTLQQQGVKVAEPLACDTSGKVIDHHYLLLAFVEGSTQVAAAKHDQAIEKMALALQAVHNSSLESLPTLPGRLEPIPEALDFLPEDEAFHPLIHLLSNKSSSFREPGVLLHGDFWPENVMWRQGEIVAILDWEDAAVGDALSDVAGTMLELRYLYGSSGAETFLKAYQAGQTIDRERLALWQIYVAAAAQKYMGQWGLPAEKEAHMRRTALTSIREADEFLRG